MYSSGKSYPIHAKDISSVCYCWICAIFFALNTLVPICFNGLRFLFVRLKLLLLLMNISFQTFLFLIGAS